MLTIHDLFSSQTQIRLCKWHMNGSVRSRKQVESLLAERIYRSASVNTVCVVRHGHVIRTEERCDHPSQERPKRLNGGAGIRDKLMQLLRSRVDVRIFPLRHRS